MNGLFLLILGVLWPRLGLEGWKDKAAAALAIFGTFANWLATLLAGVWGTGALMPIAAAGRAGSAAQEAIVNGLLLSLSCAMLGICLIVLWFLRVPAKSN